MILIAFLIFFIMAANLAMVVHVLEYGIDVLEDFFIFQYVYNKLYNLNAFGCLLVLIFGYIVLLPWAIIYWLYKLLLERR